MDTLPLMLPSIQDILEKEKTQSAAARPIAAEGTWRMFLMLDQAVKGQGFSGCGLADLFYGGCVYLGEIYPRVPGDPRCPQSSQKVIEPLMYGAKESMNFGGMWLAEVFSSSSNSEAMLDSDRDDISLMRRRFAETVGFIKNLGLHKECIFQNNDDADKKMAMFQAIEFSIRRGFANLIEEQVEALRPIHSGEAGLFLLQNNVSRMGYLASIGAWITKKPLEAFMKVGMEKFLNMGGEKNES